MDVEFFPIRHECPVLDVKLSGIEYGVTSVSLLDVGRIAERQGRHPRMDAIRYDKFAAFVDRQKCKRIVTDETVFLRKN